MADADAPPGAPSRGRRPGGTAPGARARPPPRGATARRRLRRPPPAPGSGPPARNVRGRHARSRPSPSPGGVRAASTAPVAPAMWLSRAAWMARPLAASPHQHARMLPQRRSSALSPSTGGRGCPLRTVLDCAACLPVAEALAVADSALREGLLGAADLALGAAEWPGPAQARVRRVASQAAATLPTPGSRRCGRRSSVPGFTQREATARYEWRSRRRLPANRPRQRDVIARHTAARRPPRRRPRHSPSGRRPRGMSGDHRRSWRCR